MVWTNKNKLASCELSGCEFVMEEREMLTGKPGVVMLGCDLLANITKTRANDEIKLVLGEHL